MSEIYLDRYFYFPADVEAATQGLATPMVQRGWHKRDQWLTPTETPFAGKPRRYHLAHVMEAAIFCAPTCLTLAQSREVIAKRLVDFKAISNGRPDRPTLCDLPEARHTNVDQALLWVIRLDEHAKRPRSRCGVAAVRLIDATGPGTLGDALDGHEIATVVNVTRIFGRLSEILSARIGARRRVGR